MAKELPYFKFEPNKWENGNIQMLSRDDKGLFMDLCSMYWSRLGDVPLKLAIQKICAGNATALNPLCDEKIIEVIDGNIFINFLSEQLNEFEDTRKQNSKNAKDGWVKRRKIKEESERNATASIPQCETDAIREDKIRKDKKNNIINNSLLSEIKISDDEKFFIVNGNKIEIDNTSTLFYFKTALAFQKLFIKNLKEKNSPTTQIEKTKFKSFVNPIRLLLENKEGTKEQLQEAYKYLNSKEGEFWKSNILSTAKLREKLSILIAKKNTKQETSKTSNVLVPDPHKRKKIE